MKIHFTKMHGLGNDFILIDCRKNSSGVRVPATMAKHLCHRRFGIGADQLLLLYRSRIAHFKMRIFNADGSEVEMCGNGIRCLAKYIWDKKISRRKILQVETLAGIIKPKRVGEMVKVDMGEPIFEPEKIPVKINPKALVSASRLRRQNPKAKISNFESRISNPVIDYPLKIKDREFKITCVSMGNPHAVIMVKGVSDFPVAQYGPYIENHPIFPKRTNVEFIEVTSPSEITMHVWERGTGETMACGTGASAAAVASHVKGLTERAVSIHLLGGDLFVEWAPDNHVYMTGAAEKVFEGTVKI